MQFCSQLVHLNGDDKSDPVEIVIAKWLLRVWRQGRLVTQAIVASSQREQQQQIMFRLFE